MSSEVFFVQRNFAVGDLAANRRILKESADAAAAAGAEVVLAPELALTGYPPEDLLNDESFLLAAKNEAECLALAVNPSLAVVFGLPWREGEKLYNAAVLVRGGRIEAVAKKNRLPNFSVFDERRYFTAGGEKPLIFSVNDNVYALQICQDMWDKRQAQDVRMAAAKHTLCLNASPFSVGKHARRLQAAGEFARRSDSTVYYCHMVGGQDELVFDGASFAVNRQGELLKQFPAMTEATGTIAGDSVDYPDDEDAVYAALVLGLRDFFAKTGFADGVLLGLSGGVDSALVTLIAAEALGGDKITAVMMPSVYTSKASLEDAAAIANNVGANYLEIPLTPLMGAVGESLSPYLQSRSNDPTLENVQARLRGLLLMAVANNRNALLLATGNKSEMACGYATLYGDMCGGFAPLKDVPKTMVWSLAKRYGGKIIPPRVIERPPTAELRANQTDQDTLPPYEQVDAALSIRLQDGLSAGQRGENFEDGFLNRFFGLLKGAEHKRRQAAIGPRISDCAFGRDWRMPIANRYRH